MDEPLFIYFLVDMHLGFSNSSPLSAENIPFYIVYVYVFENFIVNIVWNGISEP